MAKTQAKKAGREAGEMTTRPSMRADATRSGILPAQAIRGLITQGHIRPAMATAPGQIQPASLDLRLAEVAYRVRASFLPGPKTDVALKLSELSLHTIDLTHGAVLETGCVYVVPLLESLSLPR